MPDKTVIGPDRIDRRAWLRATALGFGTLSAAAVGRPSPSRENAEALRDRIAQASAAGVAQVLTMGNTRGNDRALWVKTFKALGPFARDHGVQVVVKQHGGNTGTGAALAAITREVADEGV